MYPGTISYYIKKNVPWHILAPRRGCFGNHLLLRRVRFLRSIFYMIGRNFLSYKKIGNRDKNRSYLFYEAIKKSPWIK